MCGVERVGYAKNVESDPERQIQRWTHNRTNVLGEHKGELVIVVVASRGNWSGVQDSYMD